MEWKLLAQPKCARPTESASALLQNYTSLQRCILQVLQRLLTVACNIAIVVLYSLLGNQLTESDLQEHLRRYSAAQPAGNELNAYLLLR